MSMPISERIARAPRPLTPGIVLSLLDGGRKGAMPASTSRSISAIAVIEGIDLTEMKTKEKAMVLGDAAAQGLAQGVL